MKCGCVDIIASNTIVTYSGMVSGSNSMANNNTNNNNDFNCVYGYRAMIAMPIMELNERTKRAHSRYVDIKQYQ